MQTGLHSQFGSGPFDVGMQVKGSGEGGGITGVPGVPTVMVREAEPPRAAGQYSTEQAGYEGTSFSNPKLDIRFVLAP